MVSFSPATGGDSGDSKYGENTQSPAAQEAARQKIALAAGSRFIRDLKELAGKPTERVNIADGPDFEESLLALQIRESVEAAGIDYETEMQALVTKGEKPEWAIKAEFYLTKMVRNVPKKLRERVCEVIREEEESDYNAQQCVNWARAFFGKEVNLTSWADMSAILLDFAFVRQGIDDGYVDQIQQHDEAEQDGGQKALPAGESEIETEIQFSPMTETPEGRAQVSTEIQQLQNIWDTAPDVSDFFGTIGSQKVTGTYEGRPLLDYLTPDGVNVRLEGEGVWQVNVPSVWGKQRWQTVGTKEEATALGERVLREHRETKALVAASPEPPKEYSPPASFGSAIERLKNATFDEGEPLQVAGEDPINEARSTAIMRVADSAREVRALMERTTQAKMGTKIKWGGMALCATMMLITGNPMYLAFMGVAYVMGWALIDKAGIERNTQNIDKTLEDKRLKELTAADRWFDDL